MIDDDRYARAVLRHTEHVLQLFVGERLINKIFARVFQSHAMGRLVIAHFDWRAGVGPRPTVAGLQAQTGSGRTLAAFIAIAKVARLVSVEPDPTDRRQKFLVPGPRIVEGLRTWLRHHLELAHAIGIMPAGCASRLYEDNAYFERFVRASIIVIDGVAEAGKRFTQWQWFEDHECGQRIAYALLRAHYQACLAAHTPVDEPLDLAISGAAVANMLGLSKSHVRNVLNGAEVRGALSHDQSRRTMRLTSEFLREARAQFAHVLTLMARTHAKAEMESGRPPACPSEHVGTLGMTSAPAIGNAASYRQHARR
ncbi:hypothetical protein GWC77_08065 [Paraburkholderia sp. NMBU_R16]|uniref:hypothetical protein n=1 Tax=Paraburkholderia sp. NMBU_R16 TaxID=2698676 RepID=UPI0015635686|nr:hypothetical protein [Paraburkholderia sp. NMBU_R16]NRO95889.1 hypothetical protein [Paraburkholderia sp. NMBU_R16]